MTDFENQFSSNPANRQTAMTTEGDESIVSGWATSSD